MGKVIAWLAGILATAIGSYAVWYYTVGPVTTIQGMVYAKGRPVAEAIVEITLSGKAGVYGPVHDTTDPNGAYRLDFVRLPWKTGAILSVNAIGYQGVTPKSLANPLASLLGSVTHVDFELAPTIISSTPAAPPAVPPANDPASASAPPAAPPRIIAAARVPAFVPKVAARATRYKF
jgi:hypothetical protein